MQLYFSTAEAIFEVAKRGIPPGSQKVPAQKKQVLKTFLFVKKVHPVLVAVPGASNIPISQC